MREQLLDFIKNLKANESIHSFDEAATKQMIILECLSLLGWDRGISGEVYPEYPVGKLKVDYALRIGNANKVFLEAKRVKEELEDHQNQLSGYFSHEGVRLAILTNGLTWWLYLPLIEGTWEQRKFYSIDIAQQEAEDIASKFVDFLARENIASGKAFDAAETVYKSQQRHKILQEALPKAWNIIISKPDELLRDLINETAESICGYRADDDMVEQFLSQYKKQLSIRVAFTAKVTSPPIRKTRSPKLTSVSEDFKDKKISSFYFRGSRYEIVTWRGLLLELCKIMNAAHSNIFDKVLELKGTTRSYFSREADLLKYPRNIPDTDLFVEQNLSARNVTQVCRSLIALFGYSDDDLKIELKEE